MPDSVPDRRRMFRAVGLIAAAPVALIAGFAWAGGWIGAPRLGGAAIVDTQEQSGGVHAGYRRAHAKGVCFAGTFEANGAGAALSTASALAPGRYPLAGRFSTAGGNPLATDGRNVFHSMALVLRTPDGQQWRMALDHTPIFPVATPDAFVELQRASRPDPATGKPDPAAMSAYLARHPETRAFQAYLADAPLPNSFANGTYYSINAFRFTDRSGTTRAVRWEMRPEDPLRALDKARLAELPRDYLFDGLMARLRQGPVRWHMIVTVAAPGDPTDNATIAWPAGRRQVDVGTLVVTHATAEEEGACRDLNFDPTVLPAGIALSDDPLLAARSAAYAVSYRRRALEGPRPSAVGATQGQAR